PARLRYRLAQFSNPCLKIVSPVVISTTKPVLVDAPCTCSFQPLRKSLSTLRQLMAVSVAPAGSRTRMVSWPALAVLPVMMGWVGVFTWKMAWVPESTENWSVTSSRDPVKSSRQIGRASCRERVEIEEFGVAVRNEQYTMDGRDELVSEEMTTMI